jgi:hypothetical protein
MKRWSVILAAAAIVMSVSSQAHARFQVIRWTSGFCQVWNHSIPGVPFPNDYRAVTPVFADFHQALAAKTDLVGQRVCW